MSIDMYVSKSQSQATSVTKMCESKIDGYSELQVAIKDFVEVSPLLTGKAYDSAKNYFQRVLYPLVKGGILLSEAVKSAVDKFPNEYISRVDSGDLKQSELEEKIKEVNRLLSQAQDIRKELNSLKTPDFTKPAQLSLNSRVIAAYSATKQRLEDQLKKLLAFNTSSPSIFSEITSLQSAVNSGLSQTVTAWDGASGTFNIPSDLSWARLLNEEWEKSSTKSSFESKLLSIELQKQYGFSDEEAQIMAKLYGNLKKKYRKDKANKLFFALLASFYYKGFKWQYTGDLKNEEALNSELKESGKLTDKEIELLSKAIINQHNVSPALSDEDASILLFDTAKTNLNDAQQDRLKILYKQFGNKPDFAHLCATISAYHTDSLLENIADTFIGILFPVSGLDANAGYIGDAAGTNGAPPSMGNDDYRADLDAVNLYYELQKENNLSKVMNDYYKNVETSSDYRATKFVENIGDGDYKKGWTLLNNQYTQFRNSSSYKKLDVHYRQIFEEFLNSLQNKNSELKSGNKR